MEKSTWPLAAAALGVAIIGGFYVWKSYGPLQVRLCEEFIKEGLASPSSYHRVAVTEDTQPVTIAELQKLRPPSFSDKYLKGERSLLVVAIQYDADNAYDANLRSAGVCAFELRDGKGDDHGWGSSARMASSRARLRDLVDAGAVPNARPGDLGAPRQFPCCL